MCTHVFFSLAQPLALFRFRSCYFLCFFPLAGERRSCERTKHCSLGTKQNLASHALSSLRGSSKKKKKKAAQKPQERKSKEKAGLRRSCAPGLLCRAPVFPFPGCVVRPDRGAVSDCGDADACFQRARRLGGPYCRRGHVVGSPPSAVIKARRAALAAAAATAPKDRLPDIIPRELLLDAALFLSLFPHFRCPAAVICHAALCFSFQAGLSHPPPPLLLRSPYGPRSCEVVIAVGLFFVVLTPHRTHTLLRNRFRIALFQLLFCDFSSSCFWLHARQFRPSVAILWNVAKALVNAMFRVQRDFLGFPACRIAALGSFHRPENQENRLLTVTWSVKRCYKIVQANLLGHSRTFG